jgi:hypothetical protein
MTTIGSPSERIAAPPACDPAVRVTRSLLGYGVLAGPLWVAIWLTQALTRDGFDLRRHPGSILANGPFGWIQVANFVAAALMALAAALGMRRALTSGVGSTWAPRLLAVFGLGLLGAGAFRADPMDGFPIGTPEGAPDMVTWHGGLHYVAASLGFLALITAAFVMARRFRSEGHRSAASSCAAVGAGFLAANVIASLVRVDHAVAANIILTIGIVAAWAWLTALAAWLYRNPGDTVPDAAAR